jgi:hypothetical protein
MHPDIKEDGFAPIKIVREIKTPNIYLPDTAWEPYETANPDSVKRAVMRVNDVPISLYAVEIVERHSCPEATSYLGNSLLSKIPYRADYSYLEIKGKKYLPLACPFSINQG